MFSDTLQTNLVGSVHPNWKAKVHLENNIDVTAKDAFKSLTHVCVQWELYLINHTRAALVI